MTENLTLPTKLYSQRAIAIATYFGGPLAAGFLVRRNFINLGKEGYGLYSLIVGIISTVLIFAGIMSIPEYIIDKIPNPLIPAIYTGIIILIIEKFQGQELRNHKTNNGDFFSLWKATGIGAICMVILLGCIFGYAYTAKDNFDAKRYDNAIALTNKNEEKALELFALIDTSSAQKSIEFIDKIGIPAWKSNLQIINELDKLEGIYDELLKQDLILRNYCNLRIRSYQFIRKALIENSNKYDSEIEKINHKIDVEIEKLKQ